MFGRVVKLAEESRIAFVDRNAACRVWRQDSAVFIYDLN